MDDTRITVPVIPEKCRLSRLTEGTLVYIHSRVGVPAAKVRAALVTFVVSCESK